MSKKKLDLLQSDGMKRFQARGGLAAIAHEQDCYRVDQHGQVALPINEDWYADLVTAGELTPIQATAPMEPVEEERPAE